MTFLWLYACVIYKSTTDQYDTLLIQLKHCVAEVKYHLMLIPDHITAGSSNHKRSRITRVKRLKRLRMFPWPALTRHTVTAGPCKKGELLTINALPLGQLEKVMLAVLAIQCKNKQKIKTLVFHNTTISIAFFVLMQ